MFSNRWKYTHLYTDINIFVIFMHIQIPYIQTSIKMLLFILWRSWHKIEGCWKFSGWANFIFRRELPVPLCLETCCFMHSNNAFALGIKFPLHRVEIEFSKTHHWLLNSFFNSYLPVPLLTLGHYWGDSLNNLIRITAFVQVWPEGVRESRNGVGPLSQIECLVEFEPGIFRF